MYSIIPPSPEKGGFKHALEIRKCKPKIVCLYKTQFFFYILWFDNHHYVSLKEIYEDTDWYTYLLKTTKQDWLDSVIGKVNISR